MLTGQSEQEIEAEFAGKGYGDFKAALTERLVATLAPIQQRYEEIRKDEPELMRLLAVGAEKARAASEPVLEQMYERMGFVRP